MKKKITVFGSLAIGFMVALFATGPLVVAHAAELSDELAQFKNITYGIFGNTEIESCEYLYGLDNSTDYIYVDFKDKGYVIYQKDSMEMLEYSATGEGPYCDIEERKYYAGPSNYYIKKDGGFINFSNNTESVVSESQAQLLAVQVNDLLSGDGNNSNGNPNIDRNNLIPATPPGTATVGYIDNAQYFVSNPMHGFNRHGTCGSVAAQLLLEYNNYYHDRRIIAPEHLNGGWNNSQGNNDLFDVGNYVSPYQNPYVCSNPMTMSSTVLGSNTDYYNYVIGKIEPKALECVDTVTTYAVDATKTTTTITVRKEYQDGTTELISTENRPYQKDDEKRFTEREHTHNGSFGSDVINGLENILKARIPENDFEIKHSKKSGAIDSAPIKAEIDAGRPLIIGMQESLGGLNHWVVGYGYQNYTYPTAHPSAGETYSGYVVHFGWGSGENNIWVNESWCNEYISLEVKHEHKLNVDTEKNIGNDKREIRCGECGFRTVDELYTLNPEGNMITGCRYDLMGQVTVPSKINGITVNAIGASTFENQIGITNIVLPSSITNIGNNAFANCEGLTNISIHSSITNIGEGAFSGCDNLNIIVSEYNPNYSAEGNILYNKDKTTLISACNVASVINIPITVTSISPYAFEGNNKLNELHINHTPNIGQLAFANCENLTKAYFYAYTVPTMDSGVFLNDDFTLYVPHSLQGIYQTAFVGYTNKIASIPIKVSFMLDDAEWNTLDTYFGANIDSSIPIPFKEGYTFNFWIDATGNTYQNGDVWDSTVDLSVEADWTARQAYINFVGYGTEGLEPILATYDMPIGILPTPSVNGPTFIGWKDENGTMYTSDTVWKRTNNLTLIADYVGEEVGDAILYYVDLDQDGGEGGSDNVRAEYLAPMPTATAPARIGYTFNGYYTGKNGTGVKYYNADMSSAKDWDIASDKTLYAYWVGKKYSLTLDLQGGYGGTTSVIATYGSPMPTLNVTAPTRTGYTFKGYYDQKNGNGTKYYDGPNISSVNDWDKTVDTTLYAYWEINTYTISFSDNYAPNSIYKTMTVRYGDIITSDDVAPGRWGYKFIGFYSNPSGTGTEYFTAEWQYDGYYWSYMLVSKNISWYQENDGVIYAKWELLTLDYGIEYFDADTGETIYTDTVKLTHDQTTTFTAKDVSGYTFDRWFADVATVSTEKSFQYKVQLIYSYVVQGPMIATYPYDTPGNIMARYTRNECVAEGTLITLADGRQVPVETLKGNERLLVWNLHTGKFDSAPILFIDKDVLNTYQIVNLAFSDGTNIKVISEHGFWDYNLNCYVYLDKNAAQYIGHWFNKQTTDENGNMISVRVQLTDVTITTEQTVAYSPVTYGHLCYYVNGMLSIPGGIDGLFNIFEVNAKSLKYDTVAMERDIEQYGLFTYEEFVQILPVPQEVFEAFNAQYFKVAIGKGIVTEERLAQLVNRYAEQLNI